MIGSCEEDIELLNVLNVGNFSTDLGSVGHSQGTLLCAVHIMALGGSSSVTAIDVDDSNLCAVVVHMKAFSKILTHMHTHIHI